MVGVMSVIERLISILAWKRRTQERKIWHVNMHCWLKWKMLFVFLTLRDVLHGAVAKCLIIQYNSNLLGNKLAEHNYELRGTKFCFPPSLTTFDAFILFLLYPFAVFYKSWIQPQYVKEW